MNRNFRDWPIVESSDVLTRVGHLVLASLSNRTLTELANRVVVKHQKDRAIVDLDPSGQISFVAREQ